VSVPEIAITCAFAEDGNTTPCIAPPVAFAKVRITGFKIYWPLLPAFTIERAASKSKTSSYGMPDFKSAQKYPDGKRRQRKISS